MAYVSFQNRSDLSCRICGEQAAGAGGELPGLEQRSRLVARRQALAAVLTRTHLAIYLMNADGGNYAPHHSSAIDTEHSSPRTVNRSTSPRTGREPADLPYGGERGRADASHLRRRLQRLAARQPDGKTLAYTRGSAGASSSWPWTREPPIQGLTDGNAQSTFAPNGRIILYASGHRQSRRALRVSRTDASATARYRAADIREPSWGPYRQLEVVTECTLHDQGATG